MKQATLVRGIVLVNTHHVAVYVNAQARCRVSPHQPCSVYTLISCSVCAECLPFSLCSSLLAQDTVWTCWFSLSAVVTGLFLSAGAWKLSQGLWKKPEEGWSHLSGCQSQGWWRRFCKQKQREAGQQIWPGHWNSILETL